MSGTTRTRGLGFLLVAGLLLLGCTRQVRVPASKMQPGTALGKSRVYLADGTLYEFQGIRFLPDSLLGVYKVLVEHRSQGEGLYYSDELRTYRFPLSRVDSVTVIQRDMGKALLYGAGFTAVGALIVNMADRGSSKRSGPTDQSKPPQN
jgi:hypothetical protein